MWTPKRIVLLALGFFVFLSGYMLYASALGGIDGLPPLPAMDLPPDHPGAVAGPIQSHGRLEDKLRQAFGQDCPELKWPLRLELNSKNMVVAAKEFHVEDDGRLELDHVSVALFGKDPGDGHGVEINTIRAKQAFLTFDKKLLGQSDKDFGGRRIVAAELIGDVNESSDEIRIVNNHRTPQRDDDLHVNIRKGPLYYDESKNLIWTDDDVTVEDDHDQPPTVVRGHGMEVHLAAAESRPDAKPAARGKPRGGGFTGVERIVIKSYVDMNLYAAGGFLSNGSEGKGKAAQPAAPPEKAHINITTPGRFEYEFRKDGDAARFDAPEADPAHPHPDDAFVSVIRFNNAAPEAKTALPAWSASTAGLLGSPLGQGPVLAASTFIPERATKTLLDQLRCQHLELRLSRKDSGPGAHDDSPDHGLTIDSAHAVAQGDELVALSSEEQKLAALCYDLQYDARTKLTVLKRDPNNPNSGVKADQDHNKIHAREIQMLELPPGPDGKPRRQVTAPGPGQIDLYDKKTDMWPVHAAWQDKLVSTKDGDQDLIILTGTATFTDDEHGQTLQADTLKVWLASAEGGTAASAPANAPTARRPSHIEAVGNVSVASSELTIPHAGRLVVSFQDVPADALPGMAPSKPESPQAAVGPAVPDAVKPAGPDAVKSAGPDLAAPAPGTAPAPAAADAPPARPISLSARSVYAKVLRSDQKSQLSELDADGDVEVHQDPAKGDETGVDVEGASLQVFYRPEGNFLVVMGEGGDGGDGGNKAKEDLAKLRMQGIYIIGPEVNIDQASNKAWVNGAGAMMMESKSDLQGKALTKPVPLTIFWKKEMFFNGRYAEFTESVQAEQDDAHLACQRLQVFFDRSVSLKGGDKKQDGKEEPPPRVKNLVCDKDVRVDEKTLDGERVVRQQQMTAPSLAMNAIEPDDPASKPDGGSDGNEVRAPGLGAIRMFQHGGADPLAAPPGPGARVTAAKPNADKAPDAAKADDATKLTYISYGGDVIGGSMYVNTKTNTATFLQNVRVLNMPCDDPNIEIDLDAILNRMPEGALYMKCDRMDVFDHGDKKKSQQEMYAKGHVAVQAKDFYGYANTMTYNEAKDQIIFEGGDSGLATLYKIKQQGAPPQKIEGKTIIYIRSTGMFKIEKGEWISVGN